mmetsp:Transcript_47952/g.114146  ORF Transcript_47952/g.114146 Transcript_47952/m.114146 type:complete len:237 (-) Transcript_47952:1579-2289(-)
MWNELSPLRAAGANASRLRSSSFSSSSAAISRSSFTLSMRFQALCSTRSVWFSACSALTTSLVWACSFWSAWMDVKATSYSARTCLSCSSKSWFRCCRDRPSSSWVAIWRRSSFWDRRRVSSSPRSARTVSSADERCITNSFVSASCLAEDWIFSWWCNAFSASTSYWLWALRPSRAFCFSRSSSDCTTSFFWRRSRSERSRRCFSIVSLASSSARSITDTTSSCRCCCTIFSAWI